MKNFYFLIFFIFSFLFVFSDNFLELEKEFACQNCSIGYISPKTIFIFNNLIYILDSRNIILVLNYNDSLAFSIGRNLYYDFIEEPAFISTDGDLVYIFDRSKKRVFYFVSPSDNDFIELQYNPPLFIPSISLKNMLWFLDRENNVLISFNLSSKQLDYYLSKGIGDGKINSPSDFTFSNNYFIVADTNNKRVQLFNPNLEFVSNIGTGSGGFILDYPTAVVADKDFIYIADSELKTIFVSDYNGSLVKKINYKDLNISEISCLYINSTHLLIGSQKHKKIFVFKLNKEYIRSDLNERLIFLRKNIELFSINYSSLFDYTSPPIKDEFSSIVNDFQIVQTLFEQRKFLEVEPKLANLEKRFETFNTSFYSQLDSSLKKKSSFLLEKIKNVSNASLVLILKENLDLSNYLLEKKEYLEAAKIFLFIEKELNNFEQLQKIPKEPEEKKIIAENFVDPKKESLKEQYFSFDQKVTKKRQDILLRAEKLNYSLSLFVLDQYLLAAKLAEKNEDYAAALDYLFEADNYLNSLHEKISEFEQTLEVLNQYKENISLMVNSSDSVALAKLAKAYAIAQTNSSLAIQEAQKAMDLAKQETQFVSLLPSPKTYAIFIFLIILGSIIIIGLILFGFLKSRLEKKRKNQQSEILIIKKAKPRK
ncbi:MAG: hypothetical protein N3D10_02730 [Candidatus Micrarchaeota archaeon]|nr:hypothetical protein [Candidatus Micrarchaeota archaeon]